MQLIKSVANMQRQALSWRAQGIRIGFVPTMGFLHAGHMSLVEQARKSVGASGKVVLSIYVNPTQFGPSEDFAKYPRDLSGDVRQCRNAGVDVVFTPTDTDIYPRQPGAEFSTFVVEDTLSRLMEGLSRPKHFRGVTTIVAKLFNIVQPNVAVFGAKDYQQAAIIQRMVRDLNFPTEVIVAPTKREADGLAMSSRNKYLEGDLRRQARMLSLAIASARQNVQSPKRRVQASRLRANLKRLIEREPDARVDYIDFFEPESLLPVKMVGPGTHMALAVFIGTTRLIDNARL